MKKNTISSSTAVDISSYTSSDYTAPADGYVVAIAAATGTTGYVRLNTIAVLSLPINQSTDARSVFVKKGALIRSDGSLYSVKYYPLA